MRTLLWKTQCHARLQCPQKHLIVVTTRGYFQADVKGLQSGLVSHCQHISVLYFCSYRAKVNSFQMYLLDSPAASSKYIFVTYF